MYGREWLRHYGNYVTHERLILSSRPYEMKKSELMRLMLWRSLVTSVPLIALLIDEDWIFYRIAHAYLDKRRLEGLISAEAALKVPTVFACSEEEEEHDCYLCFRNVHPLFEFLGRHDHGIPSCSASGENVLPLDRLSFTCDRRHKV